MESENKFWELYNLNKGAKEELESIIYELGLEFESEGENADNPLTEGDYKEVLEVYQQRNGALLDIKEMENYLYIACKNVDAFKRVDYLHSLGNDKKGVRINAGNRIYNIFIEEVE